MPPLCRKRINKKKRERIMLNETYRAMLGHKSVIRETFMYGKQRAAEIGYENVFDYSLGNPSVPCPDKFTKARKSLSPSTATAPVRATRASAPPLRPIWQRPSACPMSRRIFSPPPVRRALSPTPSAL